MVELDQAVEEFVDVPEEGMAEQRDEVPPLLEPGIREASGDVRVFASRNSPYVPSAPTGSLYVADRLTPWSLVSKSRVPPTLILTMSPGVACE